MTANTFLANQTQYYERILGQYVCNVLFTKTDGTERKMICTRDESIIHQFEPTWVGTPATQGVIPVFDLELCQWRSFNMERLKSFSIHCESKQWSRSMTSSSLNVGSIQSDFGGLNTVPAPVTTAVNSVRKQYGGVTQFIHVNRDKLKALLTDGCFVVTFIKKDGSERKLYCSLRPEVINLAGTNPGFKPKTPNPNQLSVVDIDLGEWRSFNLDKVISIQEVEAINSVVGLTYPSKMVNATLGRIV